jgi:uncharacterized protein (DUF3820 family)
MKHIQHTTKFIKELNSINHKILYTPFRISDETWLIGKHKGKKIKDIPLSYILWALKNLKMSETALLTLQQLKNKYYVESYLPKKNC